MKRVSTLIASVALTVAAGLSLMMAQLSVNKGGADWMSSLLAKTETPKSSEKQKKSQTQSLSLFYRGGNADVSVRKASHQKRVSSLQLTDTLPINLSGWSLNSNDIASGKAQCGYYNLPTTSGASSFVFAGDQTTNGFGGVYLGEYFYFSRDYNGQSGSFDGVIDVYDMSVQHKVNTIHVNNLSSYPIVPTFNPSDSCVYSLNYSENYAGMCLVKMSYTPSGVTCEPIGNINATLLGEFKSFTALTADSKGQLYCIGIGYDVSFESQYPTLVVRENRLYKVNKNTAAMTLVGNVDAESAYDAGAYIDPVTDEMYWNVAQSDGKSLIYKVDLATAEATPLIELTDGLSVAGLSKTLRFLDDDVPAACQNVSAHFTGTALTGKITLIAPATTYDGQPGVGNVDITVLGNETVIGSKQNVAYGDSVKIDVTLPAAGNYQFVVYASNDNGDGQKRYLDNMWCGPKTPSTPVPVLDFNYIDGTMSLSWPSVKAAVDGGYINTEDLTYKVTRHDGSVAVASTTDTTFSEVITQPVGPQQAYYEVVATADGVSSAAGKSNSFVIGATPQTPPYKSIFIEDALKSWTIIDANKDGKTWEPGMNNMVIEYNPIRVMDDWLITPPMELKAGLIYKVNVAARCYNSILPERFEVKLGNQPKIESMTDMVIDTTTVDKTSTTTYSGSVAPDADGRYYIGIHGISRSDKYYLYIDELSVEGGDNPTAPVAPVVLSAKANPQNPYVADFAIVAPTKNYQGQDLDSLTKLEVYRSPGTLVKTIDNPAPGDTIAFSDTVTVIGDYTYTFVAYNADGRGGDVSKDVHFGYARPQNVANAVARRTDELGELQLSWSPVEYDVNGLKFDAPCSYKLYIHDDNYGNWAQYNDMSTDTVRTIQFPPSTPTIPLFMVSAYFDSKESDEPLLIDPVPVGKPLNSVVETFANRSYDGVWLPYNDENSYVVIYTANDANNAVQSSDNGSGFLVFAGRNSTQSTANIQSALVSLEETQSPVVTFDLFNLFPAVGMPSTAVDSNLVVVSARTLNDYEWKTIYSKTVAEVCGDSEGWTKVMVDMSAYKDSVVQIKIGSDLRSEDMSMSMSIIDHITVGDYADKDLAIYNVKAPSRVKTGDSFTIEAQVANAGMSTIDEYALQLYADGKLVDELPGDTLVMMGRATHTFDVTMPRFATDSVVYTVKAIYDLDENPDNNVADIVVNAITSTLPKVTNLTATQTAGTVTLSWVEPEYTDQGPLTEITEGFENGIALDNTYGDWTFIDVDQTQLVEIDGWFDKYDNKGSFWIWDTDVLNVDYSLANNHTSKKFIFSMCRKDFGKVDDWAVSPPLGGQEQTVKFYAASMNEGYADSLEVLYSTVDTIAVTDFSTLEGWPIKVPNGWTQYSVDLPAGAAFFALRDMTTNGYGLFIDDVTFTPANFPLNLVLVGYNIYRDGERLNPLPVQNCSYVDDTPETTASSLYTVTAVYERHGESAGVNYEFIATGVENIAADRHVTITQQGGDLVISNAEGLDITVAVASGMTLYRGRATSSRTAVGVVPGVYIVRAGSTVAKIVVK